MSDLMAVHDPLAGWFPVFTLILGYAIKAAADWIQHRRTVQREREARDAADKAKRSEIRASFQRQTLLDLQDTIMKLLRATGAIHHEDVLNSRQTGHWQKALVSEEWSDKFALAQSKITMLSVRVLDQKVRELVLQIQSIATDAGMCRDEAVSRAYMMSLQDNFQALNQRIGEVLRTLDEA